MHGHLYQIVNNCTNPELNPIVDVLMKAPASRLTISRAYEMAYPNHTGYSDEIANDLYRLAVTAMNLNDGKRPSYDDMLTALCKHLGLPSTTGNVSSSEALLLNTFTPQHLMTAELGERQALVKSACTAAANAAAGIFSSDTWPPFAAGLVHIAYLRRKLVGEGRIQDNFPDKARSKSHVPVSVTTGRNAVAVETEQGEPLLTLMRDPNIGAGAWPTSISSRNAINAMTPVLKALQPFLSAEQLLSGGQYVRAILPPGATLSTGKSGFLKGVAKGHQGMVDFASVSAASLGGPAALLTLAVAVAEQKKWEDIERSLDQIKESLQDVSRFQREERRAVLTGSIRYFRQVAHAVLTGEQSDEVLHQIERHEADLVRVQEHISTEISTQIDLIGAVKKESWGSAKYVKAIEDAYDVLGRMCEEALLCVRARACGYQLLCAFPGREAGKRARLSDLNETLRLLGPTGRLTAAADRMLRQKTKDLSLEARANVLAKEILLLETIDAQGSMIQTSITMAALEPANTNEPLAIDLQLQDGEIVAVRAV